MAVRKTTVTIDDEKLQQVQEILGTRGVTETVDEAMQEVIRREAGRRHIAWLKERGPEALIALEELEALEAAKLCAP